MKDKIFHIGLIGYGQVGSHLSYIFDQVENLTLTIYNRSPISAEQRPAHATFTRDFKDLAPVDLVIIAVKDDAIIPILDQIEDQLSGDTIVCHCSGSVSSSVIKPYFDRYGVLYPLQTFSQGKKMDYSNIPVFISGSDSKTTEIIRNVARHISPKISEIGDDQRISLHIAAIFCCNYTNALYAIGEKICEDHHLDFNHLMPLIEETANKITDLSPQEAQTGPAVRGDWEIIHQHETYLSGYNDQINTLYRQMADYISKNL